jgi:ABC-2 type transport system permease protein
VADSLRAYFVIVAMWIRSAMVYRTSFVLLTVGQFVVTGLDFVTVGIMFTHTHTLGGYTLPEVAFLYAGSGVALGMADLLCGNVDRLGRRVRDGSFDVMLIRPVAPIVQMSADRFELRRLGRISQASVVLVWSMSRLPVHWRVDRIVLVPVMLISGTAIFCAIFVLGASFQFLSTDASEVVNAFTYGGNFLTQYPPTIFARELVRGATLIVPLGFVNWMPAMHILGRPMPAGIPAFLQYGSPVVAVLLGGVAGAVWQAGIRSYRSTGS